MYWSICRPKLASSRVHVLVRSIGRFAKVRFYMPRPIEQAERLLALARRDITSFLALCSHSEVDISATGFFAQQAVSPDQCSVLNPFAVILRYEETPYVSISLTEIGALVEIAYQWACDEISID